MTPDWKKQPAQKRVRDRLAYKIYKLKYRKINPNEVKSKNFPILQNIWSKIETRNLVLKPHNQKTPDEIKQQTDLLLENYYNELLESLFPTLNVASLNFLQNQCSQLQNIKNQIPILINKLATLKCEDGKNSHKIGLNAAFNLCYNHFEWHVSRFRHTYDIYLPNTSCNQAEKKYSQKFQNPQVFNDLLSEYKKEIYGLLLTSKVNQEQIIVNKIVKISSIENATIVIKRLVTSIVILQNEAEKDSVTAILDQNPEFLAINYPQFEINNAVVLFGSVDCLDKLKINLIKIFKENQNLAIDFINQLVYTIFDLELQGFDCRHKLIALIGSIMSARPETTETYFYHWLESRTLISVQSKPSRVGSELNRYLEIKAKNHTLIEDLAEKLNIYCLGRYPMTLLEKQMQSYSDKEKPFMLSVVAASDDSGDLSFLCLDLQNSLDQLGQNGNLLIFEASNHIEILKFLKHRHYRGFRAPAVLHIGAHGNSTTFRLSDQIGGDFTIETVEEIRFKPLLNYLKQNRVTVILESCSTGNGTKSLKNAALKLGIPIIAPDYDITNGTQIKLEVRNNKIEVENVIFKKA